MTEVASAGPADYAVIDTTTAVGVKARSNVLEASPAGRQNKNPSIRAGVFLMYDLWMQKQKTPACNRANGGFSI
jgi:hypothetical protein